MDMYIHVLDLPSHSTACVQCIPSLVLHAAVARLPTVHEPFESSRVWWLAWNPSWLPRNEACACWNERASGIGNHTMKVQSRPYYGVRKHILRRVFRIVMSTPLLRAAKGTCTKQTKASAYNIREWRELQRQARKFNVKGPQLLSAKLYLVLMASSPHMCVPLANDRASKGTRSGHL